MTVPDANAIGSKASSRSRSSAGVTWRKAGSRRTRCGRTAARPLRARLFASGGGAAWAPDPAVRGPRPIRPRRSARRPARRGLGLSPRPGLRGSAATADGATAAVGSGAAARLLERRFGPPLSAGAAEARRFAGVSWGIEEDELRGVAILHSRSPPIPARGSRRWLRLLLSATSAPAAAGAQFCRRHGTNCATSLPPLRGGRLAPPRRRRPAAGRLTLDAEDDAHGRHRPRRADAGWRRLDARAVTPQRRRSSARRCRCRDGGVATTSARAVDDTSRSTAAPRSLGPPDHPHPRIRSILSIPSHARRRRRPRPPRRAPPPTPPPACARAGGGATASRPTPGERPPAAARDAFREYRVWLGEK